MNSHENPRGLPVAWMNPNDVGHMTIVHPATTSAHTVPLVLATDYAALLAEVEALRADAERYRWLIQHAYIGECYTHNGTIMEVQNCDRQVPVSLDFEGSVSDAIDAAISAMEGRDRG